MIAESHIERPAAGKSDPVTELCARLQLAKTALRGGNTDLYQQVDMLLYSVTDYSGRPLSDDPVVMAAARALIGEVA